jgi:hypothetical protein
LGGSGSFGLITGSSFFIAGASILATGAFASTLAGNSFFANGFGLIGAGSFGFAPKMLLSLSTSGFDSAGCSFGYFTGSGYFSSCFFTNVFLSGSIFFSSTFGLTSSCFLTNGFLTVYSVFLLRNLDLS